MRKVCFYLVLLIMLSACGSLPFISPATDAGSGGNTGSGGNSSSGASIADAQALAQSALNRMDGGGQPSSGPVSPSAPSQAQQGAVSTATGARPAWVDSVDSVYNRSQYVAFVGNASDRAMAERNALANLVSYFGQSIQADQTITNTYREAVRNGVSSDWSDTTAMDSTIRTSASMDTLVGAEIRGVWFDSRSTYYAVAVMEKASAARVYTDMIVANQNMIRNLTAMSQTERNSMEGISRYQFAATVADINTTYGNLLRMIDAPVPAGMLSGNEYRAEAQSIIRSIPIRIIVNNDRAGRIQGAFARAVSELGFRSGGNTSRYVLEVNISLEQADLPNSNNYVYSRMNLSENLKDTGDGQILQPYNFNPALREGHLNLSEAENRVFIASERKINQEYKNVLSNYLSSLLPVR